jgi:assimilatory nitrate reductase catalytic subunit
MTILTKLRKALGIDTAQDQYAYGEDARYGYVSQSRVAEKWVKTTCG